MPPVFDPPRMRSRIHGPSDVFLTDQPSLPPFASARQAAVLSTPPPSLFPPQAEAFPGFSPLNEFALRNLLIRSHSPLLTLLERVEPRQFVSLSSTIGLTSPQLERKSLGVLPPAPVKRSGLRVGGQAMPFFNFEVFIRTSETSFPFLSDGSVLF